MKPRHLLQIPIRPSGGLAVLRRAWAVLALMMFPAVAVLTADAAQAQVTPTAVQLGMSEAGLLAVQPGLRPTRHPAHTSTGAVGKWTENVDASADTLGASTRTYYLAGGQLDQVDRTLVLASDGDSLQVYARCATALEARLGPGLKSSQTNAASQFESESWSLDDRDIYVTRTALSGRGVVRMVERRRHVMDASQL